MRGTTPTHMFQLPFDAAFIKSIRITYAHDKTPVLVKQMEDCKLDGSVVTVKLTQEDTMLFENNWLVEIQLRILTKEGEALRSKIYSRHTGVLLGDEVLV